MPKKKETATTENEVVERATTETTDANYGPAAEASAENEQAASSESTSDNGGAEEPVNEGNDNTKKGKEITCVCPHCEKEIVIELPEPVKQVRGQLKGIALVDMTDDQLAREIINSKSVLYKAEKRGAAAATIATNKARVDAALAEKAKRNPQASVTEEAPVEESVYKEETNESIAAEV